MSDGTRFGILGPLAVVVAGRPVAVTAGRDRTVLAMLLLRRGQVVSTATLIEALWGAGPPTTARTQLQSCVMRLRRLLGAGAIGSDPAGYCIRLEGDALDADVFDRLVGRARADGDAGAFREALALWRGDALAGIDSPLVRPDAAVLDERRVAAVEDWVDAEVAAGTERELLAELTGLVERYPLRERLRGQFMTVLYRAGRQADALAEYRRIRHVLIEELGVEPGPALQALHGTILAHETSATAAPRCLPRAAADFTGREATVEGLVAAIGQGAGVVSIDGMPGSGKTTLALHVARLVGDRYPDAHLFVDLHGHSEQAPLTPAAALVVLLRQLGVGPQAIPADWADRVALWRTELAGRRVLLVLDNAASSAQLAELLPAAGGSLALVTSRRRLAGLDAAAPLALPLLDPAESLALLTRVAGARVRAEPEAAAEVVARCGGLPLAIRLAGARLAHRPRWRVADLVRRLGDTPLPELAAEDRTVTAAFALSYRQLAEGARQTFRLLGIYPGATFDELAVAALTDRPLDEAEAAIEQLVDVHLLEEPESGVFRLHDLLREFAAALARELPAAQRRSALVGVLDQQLHAIAATVAPTRLGRFFSARMAAPLRPDLLAAVADPAARLERERTELAAFVETAAATEPPYAWLIPLGAWGQLWSGNYVDDIAALSGRALAAAEEHGDRTAAALLANYLASARFRRGAFDEARALLVRSVALHRELGQTKAMASGLVNLASIDTATGHFAAAIRTALQIEPLAGPTGRHELLHNLAESSCHLGRYADAVRYARRELLAGLDLGSPVAIAGSLQNLAVAKYLGGVAGLDNSLRLLRAAGRLCRRAGHRPGEAEARDVAAGLLHRGGRHAAAVAEHRAALHAVADMHNPLFETRFARGLAVALAAGGRAGEGRVAAERALRAAERMRVPYHVALAQDALARCLAADEPDRARRLLAAAAGTFAQLGTPEQDDVERRLANLGRADRPAAAPVR